jgi:hypothetical protein
VETDIIKNLIFIIMNEEEIKNIQLLLEISQSGIMDSDTKSCIKEFQKFVNLDSDGIVGSKTKSKFIDLKDNKITGWKGCKKIQIQKPTNVNIVGSQWGSCKSWWDKGGIENWNHYFTIEKSTKEFKLYYKGPNTGVSIAHKTDSKADTLHQVFNVLICEINPFIFNLKLKPLIKDIKFQYTKEFKLIITVPFEESDQTYQLDRRGGWGHKQLKGFEDMKQKCKTSIKNLKKCEGPETKIVEGSFGKIWEYFICHTL